MYQYTFGSYIIGVEVFYFKIVDGCMGVFICNIGYSGSIAVCKSTDAFCCDSDWNVLTNELLYVCIIIPCTHVVKTICVGMDTVGSVLVGENSGGS